MGLRLSVKPDFAVIPDLRIPESSAEDDLWDSCCTISREFKPSDSEEVDPPETSAGSSGAPAAIELTLVSGSDGATIGGNGERATGAFGVLFAMEESDEDAQGFTPMRGSGLVEEAEAGSDRSGK